MNTDDAVRRALKTLADADSARHASPQVERALLDAFDRQITRTSSSRSMAAAWRGVAAAAVIVLLATMAYRRVFDRSDAGPPPAEPYNTSLRSERPRLSLEGNIAAPSPIETARPSVTPAHEGAAPGARAAQPVIGHVVSASPESDPIGQIVQLRVPRSSLPLFGVPIIEPEAAGTVNVELVLSEDGQTRTIRIVQ